MEANVYFLPRANPNSTDPFLLELPFLLSLPAPRRMVQKKPKSYKIMKKSAPFCSSVLVKFTEPNRIVVFNKHVCVSDSSICTAYLPYAAVIPSETHRQRIKRTCEEIFLCLGPFLFSVRRLKFQPVNCFHCLAGFVVFCGHCFFSTQFPG